jgi:hypothetical protein
LDKPGVPDTQLAWAITEQLLEAAAADARGPIPPARSSALAEMTHHEAGTKCTILDNDHGIIS